MYSVLSASSIKCVTCVWECGKEMKGTRVGTRKTDSSPIFTLLIIWGTINNAFTFFLNPVCPPNKGGGNTSNSMLMGFDWMMSKPWPFLKV